MVRCQVLLIGGDIGQRRTCKWNIFFLLARVTGRSFSKADYKMNYIEFTGLKAFTSEFKLRTYPIKSFNGTCVRLTSITFPVIGRVC